MRENCEPAGERFAQRNGRTKKTAVFTAVCFKCTRQDLNLHESLHTPLKRTCLPFHHWCVLSYYNRFSGFVKDII